MTSAISKSTIASEITLNGFVHIAYPKSKNVGKIISSLGQVLLQTEIKENPKSTRLLASNQGMSFHTDHNTANYVAWFCNNQSFIGGQSLLIDTSKILQSFSESSLLMLREIYVNTHQVFYNDKLTFPLLSSHDNATVVYYAPWLVYSPSSIKHRKALQKFEEEIKSATPIKILLSEGDLLIIDNHRMLHGREGFPANSSRWLTRYWLKSSNINNS